MNEVDDIIAHLVEAEDEENFDEIKDILPSANEPAGKTNVKRFGRWKVVDTDRYSFLISYLTPVAYFDRVFRKYFVTTMQWSPTTSRHIADWRHMIYKSPEWQNDTANQTPREPTEWNPSTTEVAYPRFIRVRQERITDLFRAQMKTMEIKPHLKRRMYHVDPRMRPGGVDASRWLSGHLKHHDSGEHGMPSPDDPNYDEFFQNFDPPTFVDYDWSDSQSRRDTTPHETGKPDEE